MSEADPSNLLKIDFDQEAFSRDLAREIATPGVRPVDAIERLLSQHLSRSLKSALEGVFIKEPLFKIHPNYAKNSWATLPELEEGGFETYYPEIRFSTRSEVGITDVGFASPALQKAAIEYSWGLNKTHGIKVKQLKTQTNCIIKLFKIKLVKGVFQRVRKIVEASSPLEQPYLANPSPHLEEEGKSIVVGRDEFVSFDHILSGERIFCSCAKAYHQKRYDDAADVVRQYVADSWPSQVMRFVKNATYKDDICHLCIAQTSGPESAAYRYGDAMQDFVEPYTKQFLLSSNLDERTGRAEVQRILGLSRWVRETEMYQVIKEIFADSLVLREASPSWLARQRLDVYLPNFNLALEYQGQQHFQAVSVFGGADAFARTVERDALKKRLCKENGVDLIYIHFEDSLTVSSLKHRLRRYLKP